MRTRRVSLYPDFLALFKDNGWQSEETFVAVLEDLLAGVRRELNDQPTPFTWSTVGDGVTVTFTTGYKAIDSSTLIVTVDGLAVANPAGYSVDPHNGTLTFVTAPASGSIVRIIGSFFRYFTDEDLTAYVNIAVGQHTYNKTNSYGSAITISSIPSVEEYPVIILSTIECLWALATDASFDIDITAPDGVYIPRTERFQQLTTLIGQRQQQYKDLCAALNIGLWRIEMGILRRVSRTTNKLVPVYMPQEIDDSRRPERVFLQNDLYGRTPPPTNTRIYDIILFQNDTYQCEFDFPFDLTGYDLKAQIRTYPNSPSLYATFEIDFLDRPNGKVALKLYPKDTEYLPQRAFWDMVLTIPGDPTFQQTQFKGQVFVDQRVTDV